MTSITGITTIAVPVADQDEALSFYTETLGFDPGRDVVIGGRLRWVEVAPPESAVTLALVVATESTPAGRDTGIRLITADADADRAALVEAGVDASEVMHWDGVPAMFSLRDPDGNVLYVVEAA